MASFETFWNINSSKEMNKSDFLDKPWELPKVTEAYKDSSYYVGTPPTLSTGITLLGNLKVWSRQNMQWATFKFEFFTLLRISSKIQNNNSWKPLNLPLFAIIVQKRFWLKSNQRNYGYESLK